MSQENRVGDDIIDLGALEQSEPPGHVVEPVRDDDSCGFGPVLKASASTTLGVCDRDGTVRRRRRQRRKKRLKLPPAEEVLARPDDYREAALTWPGEFHWDIVRYCEQAVTSHYLEGRLLLPKAVGLLSGLGDSCLDAQLECCLAASYRLSGDLERAEQMLLKELGRATGRPCCDADFSRRLGNVYRDQKRFPEAFERYAHAIDRYRVSDVDHDLPGNGLADTMMSRGIAWYESGHLTESITELSSALELIDPRISPRLQRDCTFNLAFGLASSKRPEHFMAVVPHLEGPSLSLFSRSRKVSQERAKYFWLYGLVMSRLGSTRRGIHFLGRARQDLITLRMPQEVLVITADLGCMEASRTKIQSFFLELTEKLDNGLYRIREWIPDPFRKPIKEILRVTCVRDEQAEILECMLADLRELAGGNRIMPCLI